RLGKPHLADSFLLNNHPEFQVGPLLNRARAVRGEAESKALSDEVLRLIEPFNVAGLGNPQLRNWYPASAQALLRAAPKLGADREETASMLRRCGFEAAASQ